MKVLVTGGAGFVGTNLVLKLKEDGHDIIVIDNYSVGKRENHVEGVKYIDSDTKYIDTHMDSKPDIIYHLGEYSRIAPSFIEVQKIFDYNILGSFAIIDFARRCEIPIVYAASSTKMAHEGENHSPYSFFKSFVVQLIRNYANWYGLQYSICYFYNVYGEYQDTWGKEWQTVVGVFENQWRNNEPLTVVGDGEQRRDFTYVGDIVSGLLMAADNIKNEEYQLGTGRDYSILEVAHMFSDNVTFVPPRRGDRRRGLANVEDTFKKLGWRAETTLESWIEKVKNK